MTLEVFCAHCGNEKEIEVSTLISKLKAKKYKWRPHDRFHGFLGVLCSVVEKRSACKRTGQVSQWVMQVNGDNIDLYCSKECAL